MFVTPKFCISIVFSVSWAFWTPKRNWRQCLCKILGWQAKSIMACYGIFWSGQQKTSPLFAKSDINPREVGRIRDSYANPRWSGGFALDLSRILPTPRDRVFILGRRLCKYTKKAFYCLYKLTSSRKNAKTFGTG